MENQCTEALNALTKTGINFVAVDFDMTLISMHTSGQYQGTPVELAKLIRPCFLLMIPCLVAKNIAVAIVTFSDQTKLIRDVIRIGFPYHFSKIVIRTSDKSWGDMGIQDSHGKQKYIASAAEDSEHIFKLDIKRSSTLLIDDHQQNIRISLKSGVRALLFIPENPNSIFGEMIQLNRI